MSSTTPQSVKSPLDNKAWLERYSSMNSVVVRAGAGAGKTTELVQRVLAIAKKYKTGKEQWPRLVVTTFTRKATQELRERLMHEALAKEDAELVEFVQKQSLLHISTIHGVLSLYLARYGSRIGLNPKFSFIDQQQEERALKKIVRGCLSQVEEAQALEMLLEQVDLKKILKALRSYAEARFEQNQKLTPAKIEDSFDLIQRMDLEWIQESEDFIQTVSRAEKPEAWHNYLTLLQQAIDKLKESYRNNTNQNRAEILLHFFDNKGRPQLKNSEEAVSKLRDKIQNYAKGKIKWVDTPEGWDEHQRLTLGFQNLAEAVFEKIIAQKMSMATLTMQDLELLSLKLVHEYPDSAKHFSSEWDFWLIDEYQDTSPRQVLLLKKLIGGANSFTVGDPQQSIYLFRGARSEVFEQKELENEQAGGQSLQKMENYRSRPELLHFFNHFFSRLGNQFRPMIAANSDIPSELPAAIFMACPEPEKEPSPERLTEEDEESGGSLEHQAVIARCLQLLREETPPEQICVLSRTNGELDKIAELCHRAGISVQVHASSKFYSRREIKDALALLKFLVNPNDNLNLLELLRSPWFLVSDTDLIKSVANYSENFWPELKVKLAENESLKQLLQLQQLTEKVGIGQAWAEGVLGCGLLLSARMVESTGRREANLWKLINLLKAEEKRPGFSYLEFSERSESSIQDLEAGSDGDATPVEVPQRVNLMTIHASKGLQFDHVILPAMGKIRNQKKSEFFSFDEERKLFCLSVNDPETSKPEQNMVANDSAEKVKSRELKEHDRLLYVALTRAKKDVTLIWSKVSEKSWAARMWRPTDEALQRHQEFSTLYFPNFQASYEPLLLSSKATEKIPKALPLAAEIKSGLISVTRLLEAGISNSQKSLMSQESLGKNATEFSNKESSEERVKKTVQGVESHRLFESLKYRGENLPEAILNSSEFQFIKNWQEGRMLNWIRQGEVEWGFCVTLGSHWIQGQIDLWAMEENGQIVIVDYKTGSTKYSEKAFEQLEIYAMALRQMKKAQEKISLVVVYPFEEKVMERVARSSKEIQDDLKQRLLDLN